VDIVGSGLEARELRYFVTVADELHFGHAARRLSVALPVLSRTVRRMEAELGVELFVRDSQPMRLTSAGQTLLGPARDALAAFDEAVAASREAAGCDIEGSVAVGVSPLLRHRLVPWILKSFASLYPLVHVSSMQEFSGMLLDELRARRIDCAIGLMLPRHSEFLYEPIRDAELCMLISSRHRLAGRSRVSLGEFEHDRFELPSDSSSPALNELIVRLCADAGFELKRGPVPVDQDMALIQIKANRAVTFISRFYVDDPIPGMVQIPLELPGEQPPLELVRRRERPSPTLSRFSKVVTVIAKLDYDALGGPPLEDEGGATRGARFGPARREGRYEPSASQPSSAEV
jgi:DNA-binding transcriptional LysR family regulator